jgi:hypothetical protein
VTEWTRIALFLLAISLPGVAMLIAPTPPVRGEKAAKKVKSKAASPLEEAARRFERRFGFREPLLRLHGLLMVRHLGVSNTEMTLVGRDGWFFLARETPTAGPLNALIYSRNGAPFRPDELARCGATMEAWRIRLAAKGCRYLFVVAPNKDTIYPEKMPPGFTRLHPDSRLDQLLAYLREHTQVAAVDLRPALFRAKQNGSVFYRTDTHWNAAGAFAAQAAIAEALQPWFPTLRPLAIDEYTITRGSRPGGDLARTLGVHEALQEPDVRFTPHNPSRIRGLDASGDPALDQARNERELVTEAPRAPVGRAVIQRDSFGEALAPFLAPHFRRTVFVWNSAIGGLDWTVIDREQPDLVLHEVVERSLLDTRSLQTPPPPPTSGNETLRQKVEEPRKRPRAR